MPSGGFRLTTDKASALRPESARRCGNYSFRSARPARREPARAPHRPQQLERPLSTLGRRSLFLKAATQGSSSTGGPPSHSARRPSQRERQLLLRPPKACRVAVRANIPRPRRSPLRVGQCATSPAARARPDRRVPPGRCPCRRTSAGTCLRGVRASGGRQSSLSPSRQEQQRPCRDPLTRRQTRALTQVASKPTNAGDVDRSRRQGPSE